ncbi:hypothetical protein Sjap_000075 [Stephania japonica]|uniref:Uncharacterized protein n=1 Tax=Stephania japonica TaxID=461633 RepID=A0AAP0KJY4_9MAGN
MAAWASTARQALSLGCLSSSPPLPEPLISSSAAASPVAVVPIYFTSISSLTNRFSSETYHHGPQKVNCWQDPMSPSKWKEEHFVIVSLSGWGLLFYGGYKFFTGGNKDKKEEVIVAKMLLHFISI